ncbi:MAG: hypothetical protein HY901_15150 [Deltaproteobacteria bacterium]|nr:hypothetical protein [Deltaproteobacteria bacterium]
MKLVAGLFLIAVSGGVFLYTRSASQGQLTYVMWGPALFGATLLLRGWAER